MSCIIEEFVHKGYTVKIVADEDPYSPREDGNLGRMVCFHNRYTLGDKTKLEQDDFDGWDELETYLRREEKAVLVAPLFLYDHSGISISIGDFHDVIGCKRVRGRTGWDSGQVGFVYVTRQALLEENSAKRLTKAMLDRAETVLEGEVETYDQYLTGDVWGYIITKEGEEDELRSCWGFYGTEYCIEEAKSEADCYAESDEATRNGENVNGDGI